MSPEDAVAADPSDLFQDIKRMGEIGEEKKKEEAKASLDGQDSVTDISSLAENSTNMSMKLRDGSSVLPSSIGDSMQLPSTKGAHRHGYGKNKNIREGDILPTGHTVKSAYPKSIQDKIHLTEEWQSMQSAKSEDPKLMKKWRKKTKKIREPINFE